MPDVLDNLKKLPPRCIGKIGGRNVLIQRGVMGYVETELSPELYEHIPVSPAQRQAMEVGCTVGWDKLGANPDVYEQTNSGEVVVKTRFRYAVPFILTCEFVNEAEGMADAAAERFANEIQFRLQELVDECAEIVSFSIDDQLQLVSKERLA